MEQNLNNMKQVSHNIFLKALQAFLRRLEKSLSGG